MQQAAGKEFLNMNEEQKRQFRFVIAVFTAGSLAVLLVPLAFHCIF